MTVHKSISNQISSISRTLIIGLLVLSMFAIASTLTVRSIFVEYHKTALSTLKSNEILEDIFEARIEALKWRISDSDGHIAEFNDNLEELRAAASDLTEVTRGSAEVINALSEKPGDLDAYEDHFLNAVEAQSAYNTAEAAVTEAGLTARRMLSEIMTSAFEDQDPTAAYYAGRSIEALMLGRYYLERFRQSETQEDLERAFAEVTNAQAEIATLQTELQNPRRVELAASAADEVQKFIDNKSVLADSIAALIVAREAMDQIGPKIVGGVEFAVESAVTRQNTLGPRGRLISFWAVVAIVTSAFLITAFGARFSKRTASRLTNGIETAVDCMTRIAEGDLETEVPNANAENEIGRMAKALEVFKNNGKATIEAAEREKAAEEQRRVETEAAKAAQAERDEQARKETEAARKAVISGLNQSVGYVVSAASEGDFSQRIDVQFDDQELAELADNVNALIESVEEGLSVTSAVLSKVAGGDLTQKMEGNFKGAFSELQSNTNEMIGALISLLGDILVSGETLGSSAKELQESSSGLSRQAEQNAAAIEETSAALEELTAQMKQVSDNVSEADANVRETSKTAETSSQVAHAAADAMNRIAEASSEISKVVSVINDISFQINLLALNAGVEAARAGEAGQGFSVVAAEVRQLAQRASEAAKEIANVIAHSDTAVAEGVAKVADAQSSLATISESVIQISNRIGTVANSMNEQVQGVSEINTAITQLDQNTQRQAATAEELTASSSLLASESNNLTASTSRFETGLTPAKPAPQEKANPVSEPRPQPKVTSGSNLAVAEESWEEF